jgi:hypothetical protein
MPPAVFIKIYELRKESSRSRCCVSESRRARLTGPCSPHGTSKPDTRHAGVCVASEWCVRRHRTRRDTRADSRSRQAGLPGTERVIQQLVFVSQPLSSGRPRFRFTQRKWTSWSRDPDELLHGFSTSRALELVPRRGGQRPCRARWWRTPSQSSTWSLAFLGPERDGAARPTRARPLASALRARHVGLDRGASYRELLSYSATLRAAISGRPSMTAKVSPRASVQAPS